MELYQLRTFVAVAQHGHLTKAAEVLHLSQPAVTAQIKALEEELGVSLFTRTPGGTLLTPAGEQLLQDAEQVLGLARAMRGKAQQLKTEVLGRLCIGTILDPSMLGLGDVLVKLRERFPLLEIQLRHNLSGIVINQVRKKEIDCGFYLGSNPYSNVYAMPLRDQSFSVVAPRAWADKLLSLSLSEAGDFPWLGYTQFTAYERIAQEFFREHNLNPRKAFEVDHEGSMLAMVEAGGGLSLMRAQLADEAARRGRLFVWQPHVKRALLSFVYPLENRDDLVLRTLVEILKNEWGIHP